MNVVFLRFFLIAEKCFAYLDLVEGRCNTCGFEGEFDLILDEYFAKWHNMFWMLKQKNDKRRKRKKARLNMKIARIHINSQIKERIGEVLWKRLGHDSIDIANVLDDLCGTNLAKERGIELDRRIKAEERNN